jgi:hypothetical protein
VAADIALRDGVVLRDIRGEDVRDILNREGAALD